MEVLTSESLALLVRGLETSRLIRVTLLKQRNLGPSGLHLVQRQRSRLAQNSDLLKVLCLRRLQISQLVFFFFARGSDDKSEAFGTS
jgi:hypothetical protein